MFQSLLVCTDLCDGLQRLTQFTSSLAMGGVEQIVFLHTLAISNEREIPKLNPAEVERVRRRLIHPNPTSTDITVHIEVQQGRPIDRILSTANSYRSSLIVLGTPTRSLLTEKLMGSTLMGLCQRSPLPILILRPALLTALTPEELDLRCHHLCRRLLIPYDGSRTADYLVQQLSQQISQHGPAFRPDLVLCWTVEEATRRSLSSVAQAKAVQVDAAEAKLADVKAQLETLGFTVTTQVRQGDPVAETLIAAQDYGVSAIASSSGSLGKLIEFSIPSFSGELLRRSHHPVLYIPPKQ